MKILIGNHVIHIYKRERTVTENTNKKNDTKEQTYALPDGIQRSITSDSLSLVPTPQRKKYQAFFENIVTGKQVSQSLCYRDWETGFPDDLP